MVDRGALSVKILSSYHDSAIGVRPFYPFIYSFIFPNIPARHSLQYSWNNPFIMISWSPHPTIYINRLTQKNINYNSYVIIEILLLILKSSEPISLGKDFSECICSKHEQVSIDFFLENNSLGAQTILDKTRWDTPAPLFNVGYMIFCSRHTFTVFAQHWKGGAGFNVILGTAIHEYYDKVSQQFCPRL